MTGALVDNDVVIKVAAYGFGEQFVQATTISGVAPSMLGVGRFVVRDRLSRPGRFNDSRKAIEHFEALLPSLASAEPTEAELQQAAAFEAAATKANLEFDTGESQLLAMLLTRSARLLITGDKRAIAAVAQICGDAANGRVACFEQVVTTTIKQLGSGPVRDAVCREPQADKSTTNCFACSNPDAPPEADICSGLGSYIGDIRKKALEVIYIYDDLLPLTAEENSVGVSEGSN